MSLRGGKTRKRRNFYLQPGGGEGVTLKITEEADIGFTTEQIEKLPYQYIKLNKGWDFPDEKIYFSVRGDIPITSYITEDEENWVPITDFLQWAWGEHYEAMPDTLKSRLLDLGVTVTVKPVDMSPEQERKLTPYLVFQVMREHFKNVLSSWARSDPKVDFKDRLLGQVLNWVAAAGVMYFLLKQGIV